MLAKLANGPTVCGLAARGGCIFARNVSVIRTAILAEAETRATPNMSLH